MYSNVLFHFCQLLTQPKRELLSNRYPKVQSPSKSCKLDSIPTWLMKTHIDAFISFITHVINCSFTSAVFPKYMGRALITPVLKKPSLDSNDFSNYRPVSNINFISKIIEKVASNQLKDYLCKNNLIDMYQSAYVSNRSTETALLKVKSDVLNAVDRQEVVFLVMLDLSAAFDTIDHALMLKHFETNMGISGCALQWLKSYLESRMYQVNIDGVLSETHKLDFGVPQGSVLGPLCFILYTSPVGKIIFMQMTHKCTFHVIQKYQEHVKVHLPN